MKTCEKCRTEHNDDAKFCRQCGKPFAAESPPADATVRYTGGKLSGSELARHPVPVATLFEGKDRLVLGRAEDCDICLPHPLVSRYHALAETKPDGVHLRDLGSVNGTWLNGKRLKEPAVLREGDRVGIGPYLFTLKDGGVRSIDNSVGLRLEAHHLEKSVPVPGGQRKLLDDINLVVNPGEFVTILGPSGCGKSTLMDCLNGRRRATAGRVLANGEDFYRNFNSFRQSLGYVPQRDIVHGGLTVFKALYYTAKLRLPADTSRDELRQRVEAVLKEMELLPHGDTLIERLSGGQIKRVSLGAELLARPSLLYIDEATSGLDAGTEAKMMRLFRRLSDEGRSIICITHALENVDQCHLILVLARGRMIYYGPPGEAPHYFKVARISDIYDRIGERDVEAWGKDFRASAYYRELVQERLGAAASSPTSTGSPDQTEVLGPRRVADPAATPAPAEHQTVISREAEEAEPSKGTPLAENIRRLTEAALDWRSYWRPIKDGFRQFGVLTRRYLELIWSDRKSLLLQLLQAPIVALVVLVAFYNKPFQGPESKLPFPRKFTAEERKVVDALRELTQARAALEAGKLTPEDEKRLAETKVATEFLNPLTLSRQKVEVSGLQLLRLAERASLAEEGSPAREAVERLKLTFKPGREPVTLEMKELEQILQQTRETKLLETLANYDGPVVPKGDLISPRYSYMLLFIIVVVVMWFGCNNASKEIVKEEAIYARERAVNLGILPYLASKFLVQSVLTMVQIVLLVGCVFGVLHALHAAWPDHFTTPPAQYMLDYLPLTLVLFLLGIAGVAMGLALSACVRTPDQANSLLPYVMIPQLIFGGGIMSVGTGLLYLLAGTLSPVYWAFRAVHLNANSLPKEFPGWVPYTDSLWLPVQALLLQTAILLALTVLFLRRKDV